MKAFLYGIVEMIAEIHSYLLKLNDAYEYNFTDKELHFLIIGALGMMMIFVVHPLFKWLARNNHIMVISWIYVFTHRDRPEGDTYRFHGICGYRVRGDGIHLYVCGIFHCQRNLSSDFAAARKEKMGRT